MSRPAWNPPPNWPTPPEGWTPPPGWQPDPAWGPAPDGWSFTGGDDAPAQETPADDPVLGSRAARRWRKAGPGLRAHLEPGERIQAFLLSTTLRPLTDFIAVTSSRVIAGAVADLSHTPPRVRTVDLADVADVEVEPAAVSRLPKLSVRRTDGSVEFLGQLQDADDETVFRDAVGIAARPAARPAEPRPVTRPADVPTVAPLLAAPSAPPAPAPTAVRAPSVPSRVERPDQEARIRRLLDESVIDADQATYIRSVLFG